MRSAGTLPPARRARVPVARPAPAGFRTPDAMVALRKAGLRRARPLGWRQAGILAWADQVDPSIPKY